METEARKEAASPTHRPRLPLALRVLIGVCLGIVLGLVFKTRPWWPHGLTNKDLGEIGKLVITMLKMLATPLVFFAILDAFLQTRIAARRGVKLVFICLLNVSVAMAITLILINTLKPGLQWLGHTDQLLGVIKANSDLDAPGSAKGASLDLIPTLKRIIPENLGTPIKDNNVIAVVFLTVLVGAALRRIKDRNDAAAEEIKNVPDGEAKAEREKEIAAGNAALGTVERLVSIGYQVMVQLLEWVVQWVPFAVMTAVAKAVGESGLIVFSYLWVFLAVVLLALALHSLLYYPFIAWVMGGKTPRVFLGVGWDAILTGLSTNSSLATVPHTLECLKKMGVSKSSARLAACIGTNLNNDGITLYEAMAALFMAQALGAHLVLGKQMVVVFASIIAGAGIAGIPDAGIIILPLVLSAAGLSEASVTAIIPIILPVDWIIARCRSGVNVMSDMLVAIQLDGRNPQPDAAEAGDMPDVLSETFPAIEAIAQRESAL